MNAVRAPKFEHLSFLIYDFLNWQLTLINFHGSCWIFVLVFHDIRKSYSNNTLTSIKDTIEKKMSLQLHVFADFLVCSFLPALRYWICCDVSVFHMSSHPLNWIPLELESLHAFQHAVNVGARAHHDAINGSPRDATPTFGLVTNTAFASL